MAGRTPCPWSLRLSFVPLKEIRRLRALTRYRSKLVALRTGARNRTIKLVEMAGVKLSSVATDSFGKTGRLILDGLCRVQIAWAASRKKDSFLRARFLRLQARIGRAKAIVALARQILVVVFHVLSDERPYTDLGSNFYASRHKEQAAENYIKRLTKLGFNVTLTANTDD